MNNNNKQEISIENLSNLRNNWFNNYFIKNNNRGIIYYGYEC